MTHPSMPPGTPNGPLRPRHSDLPARDAAQVARDTFTVPLTQCCGGMPGDTCDCASFATQLAVAFSRPIGWRAA